MDIASIRTDYTLKTLGKKETNDSGLEQFKTWFQEALSAKVTEPNAFTLATSSNDYPDARILLLKGIDDKGFQFFTNYQSVKGQQIEANPKGCMVFFWPELQRQVRIRGIIAKTSAEENDEYFFSRPVESQIGAHVSQQSQIVDSREVFEKTVAKKVDFFKTHEVTRPEHWGGYRLIPTEIEFWQGRASRLHDRIKYVKQNNLWTRERLQP